MNTDPDTVFNSQTKLIRRKCPNWIGETLITYSSRLVVFLAHRSHIVSCVREAVASHPTPLCVLDGSHQGHQASPAVF